MDLPHWLYLARLCIWEAVISGLIISVKKLTIVFAPLSGTPLYLVAEPLFGFTKGFIYTYPVEVYDNPMAY